MIYLGADHGGYELKEKVKGWLGEWGYEFEDLGAYEMNAEDDYTEFAITVARRVDEETDRSQLWKDQAKGVLLCRSGGGMAIAANRFTGVRADYVFDEESAEHARDNNDANVITLAGDWIDEEMAKQTLKAWLGTEFSGEERHERRVRALSELQATGDK